MQATRWNDILESAKILIVDDEEAHVRLLERMFESAGYKGVMTTTDSRKVVALHQQVQPDLILLDLEMPEADGYQVLEELKPHVPAGSYLPILVITGHHEPEHRLRALLAGAKDFINKPVDRLELMLRVRIQLETRFLFLKLIELSTPAA